MMMNTEEEGPVPIPPPPEPPQNNHNNHVNEEPETNKENDHQEAEVDQDLHNLQDHQDPSSKIINDAVSEGENEVANIMKDVSETNDSTYSPPPPRKIAKRSRDSTSNRKSTSSPRLKSSTPNSVSGTPYGSSSEREPNSSPASIDNPPTNGSITNDGDGDGERSDKTESGDNHSVSSSTTHTHAPCTNGPTMNNSNSNPSLTKRSVTIQMLLTAGILKPGEGTMSLEYHGQKFVADLLETGQIKSQETSLEFSSPSAWAIACKQIINPEKIQRKSGCGWASIKYKGLKLDYYKTVWFKRLREGAIDIKHISNGTSSTSEDSDEEDAPFCVLKFGEHLDSNPIVQSAQQLGAKVMVGCSRFLDIDRLQPFYVKMSTEALALADFHCNITGTESLGYISGKWNYEQNCLKMEVVHPCKVLMPNSTSVDCDTERNRIAISIQRLGHDVVGWYHSHPKAPPQPSRDDISRQLDYQIVMKGASESSYIPCIGVILSPVCYSSHDELKSSPIQFFWVMPPPENRPMDLGRPMHVDYETFSSSNLDLKKLLIEMGKLIQFYTEKKNFVDMNDLSNGKFERLRESFSTFLPETRMNDDFWDEVRHLFTSPPGRNSTGSSNVSSSSSITGITANGLSIFPSVSTPNSVVSNSTPPVVATPTPMLDPVMDAMDDTPDKS